jgi:hypothetical protein
MSESALRLPTDVIDVALSSIEPPITHDGAMLASDMPEHKLARCKVCAEEAVPSGMLCLPALI